LRSAFPLPAAADALSGIKYSNTRLAHPAGVCPSQSASRKFRATKIFAAAMSRMRSFPGDNFPHASISRGRCDPRSNLFRMRFFPPSGRAYFPHVYFPGERVNRRFAAFFRLFPST
jgi:hypothetical protein